MGNHDSHHLDKFQFCIWDERLEVSIIGYGAAPKMFVIWCLCSPFLLPVLTPPPQKKVLIVMDHVCTITIYTHVYNKIPRHQTLDCTLYSISIYKFSGIYWFQFKKSQWYLFNFNSEPLLCLPYPLCILFRQAFIYTPRTHLWIIFVINILSYGMY